MLCRHFVFYNTIFRAALCVVPTYDIAAVSLRHVVFSLFTITSSILRKLHPLKQHHGPLCINDSSRRGICSGRRRCLPHTAVVDTSSYHQIAPHGIIISWTAERNHRRKRRKGTTLLWRFCTLLLAIGRRCCGGVVVCGGGDRHRCRACLHRTRNVGGDCNDGNCIMVMGARGGGRGGGCFNDGRENHRVDCEHALGETICESANDVLNSHRTGIYYVKCEASSHQRSSTKANFQCTQS
jgi:hypothetical protein